MTDDYYADFCDHLDPARAVGWESVPAQHARYEVVSGFIGIDESVLDVGAGLGDFGRFLQTHGHRGAYLGLERNARLLTRGQARLPSVSLQGSDFMRAFLPEADVVVGIGVLVDGHNSVRLSDGDRYGRVRALLERVSSAARRRAVVVMLDQDRLEADPIRSLEFALHGVRRAEVPWLSQALPIIETIDIGATDLALVLQVSR